MIHESLTKTTTSYCDASCAPNPSNPIRDFALPAFHVQAETLQEMVKGPVWTRIRAKALCSGWGMHRHQPTSAKHDSSLFMLQ